MPISGSFLQELKYKTDIEDIISAYVTLRKRGNTYVGLCPFHNEKTPSFTVYPETQSFYCFGCGAGGDTVGFIRKIENLDYVDAVKLLADRAGLEMPQDGFDDSVSKQRRRVLEANRAAAKYFHTMLMSEDGKPALDYLKGRGLTSKTITKFGLGFAPNEWHALTNELTKQGFTHNDLMQAGLIRKSDKGYYDNFRNRVMTPIIDVRGNVIAFGGRVLDDSKPKYINTGDTLVYKKTNELFSLNNAKDSGEDSLILCEGYMDVISMYQAGFKNAVAGCGTALTNEQVKLISRYAKEVVLAYDADEAGQKAVQKAMPLFKNSDVKVRVPALKYGKDPDEIIKNVGVDAFRGMLEGATNEIEFEIIKLRNMFNLNTTQGKIDFVNEIIKTLADATPVEQDLYLSRISEELGIEKRNIKTQLDDYVRKTSRSRRRSEYNSIVNESIRQNARLGFQTDSSSLKIKAEDRLIYLLIKYPDCHRLLSNFNPEYLTEGFIQKVYSLICRNIENSADTDLMSFSADLSGDEMGRLSGIIARGQPSVEPKTEFKDCLNVIINEHNKKKSSVDNISDDDFRKMFDNN